MTTIIPQILTKLTNYKTPTTKTIHSTKPRNYFTKRLICFYHNQGFEPFLLGKDSFNIKTSKNKKRVVLVRLNNFKFNGGGGGGGKDDAGTSRVLVNLGLAIGLTYLSLTGQLGWILDAIVSVWLFVVIVPIVGLGALIWWASRDMVEIKCRNCGNEFEVFKSMLNDEPRTCPYCTQPFSVVGDEFVRDTGKPSNESTTFGEAFNNLTSRPKKGKASSNVVIDIEAEVRDVE